MGLGLFEDCTQMLMKVGRKRLRVVNAQNVLERTEVIPGMRYRFLEEHMRTTVYMIYGAAVLSP